MTKDILKGMNVLLREGPLTFLYKLKLRCKGQSKNQYYRWIKENEKDILKTQELIYNPLLSIIVPVYNVIDKQLIECIESVKKQSYSNWELCLVDDASTWDSVRKVLKKYENTDRIKIRYRVENGHISKATNDGINMATGEFIAFLDCDDILAPNALYEMAKKLNENPLYDFIYSDEDKVSDDGKVRHSPFFKPDWSPDTLMSLMYTCHFSLYRRSLVSEIGGLREGFEGAQDYDFTLRFTELTNKIGHISKILYHWRERKESTALNPQSKPYIFEATKKAKQEAILRRGLNAELEFLDEINQYQVKYYNRQCPKVSIIIPSKDNYTILSQCINSLICSTTYNNYEVIVIDNGSNEDNKKLYEELCNKNKCVYHYKKMDFNFSKMCNIGSKLATGEYFLFLNDDIEIITDKWIDILVGHASISYVGAVGAKLYYPGSDFIQHVGVTNLGVGPSHSFVKFSDQHQYYYGRNKIEYNYIAVTGACLIVEKDKYIKVGGFDESLPIGYNDIDLCFKLVEEGYYNVVRTDVILYHHESISRGNDLEDAKKMARLKNELFKLYQKHPHFRGKDPFYNPNLSQNSVDFNMNLSVEKIENEVTIYKKNINKNINSDTIEFYIDSMNVSGDISIEGWVLRKDALFSNMTKKKLLLINKDNNTIYQINTFPFYRPDVTSAFGNKKNHNFSGFKCVFNKNSINKNRYEIYILTSNFVGLNKYIINTNKIMEID